MSFGIVSLVLNAVYMAVMFIDIYTDRFFVPTADGGVAERIIKRSPASRLGAMDQGWLFILLVITVAVSAVSSLLVLLGGSAQDSESRFHRFDNCLCDHNDSHNESDIYLLGNLRVSFFVTKPCDM